MIKFSQAPKAICIFRISAIGDVTHILPVIHTLKKTWPETRITWVIGLLEYQLVKNLPGVEFVLFDKSKGWAAYQDLRQQLKGQTFDVLLMMQAALRASMASLFISAKHKLGFDSARAIDYQWLFSNQKITGNNRVHVLDGFFQFLECIGIEEKIYSWDLPIDAADLLFAEQVAENKPYIVMNPCSSARKNNWRNWPVNRYAEVCDYLHDKGMQVLITGSPAAAEQSFCQSILDQAQSNPKNLAGNTSLGQLLALLKGAKFLIAPDTGPAHMATLVDTPVLGLYASSNPARTGPYKSQSLLINKYPAALQQFKQKSVDDAAWGERIRDPQVMDLISVDEVKHRIKPLLRSDA
ncbi:MAG: heptosyltransferase I [Gammaproteobacteria bacterium]|jgi:heptosyltransferase I